MSRAFVSFFASAIIAGCVNMETGAGDADGGTAGASGGDGGTAAPCSLFRDVTGQCLDPSCLQTQACDTGTAAAACGTGSAGEPGACFGGLCMYQNPALGCASSAQCPCGFCGADGHCYEDRGGACGVCRQNQTTTGGGAMPKQVGNGSAACTGCLSACAGTGPSCCAGCGCVCEGECGACQ